MVDGGGASLLAALLAAIAAAAFICVVFYPLLTRSPLMAQRSAIFETLLRGSANRVMPISRVLRRAQDSALRSVAQHSKPAGMSQIRTQLMAAGFDCSPRCYFVASVAIGIIVFAIGASFGPSPTSAIGSACLTAWLLPQRYLAFRARRRKLTFLKAFTSAVDMIVRGAKSGLALNDCLAIVACDAEEPVRSEFDAILAQLKAGVPLAAALDRLATAMPVVEVRFFVQIMSMQLQTGGNLSEVLGNLACVLRDRDKIASKIRIASAEVRASALIIGALPVCVIAATAFFAPNYIAMLWEDATGRRVAGFCAVWLAAGIIVLRQMARIEV